MSLISYLLFFTVKSSRKTDVSLTTCLYAYNIKHFTITPALLLCDKTSPCFTILPPDQYLIPGCEKPRVI